MIYNNIYEYDIKSCYPNIYATYFNYTDLQNMDKSERNMYVGQYLKDKRIMQNHIYKILDNMIYLFMQDNHISNKDIIIRQKDGILCKKYGKIVRDNILYPRMKNKFNYFITDELFKKYIGFNFIKQTCILKGISHKSINIEKFLFYNLKNIDLENITSTIKLLKKIKKVFYNSNDKLLFAIDNGDNNYIFYSKKDGKILIDKQQYKYISLDLDKDKYFKNYFFWWDILMNDYVNFKKI